MSEKSETAWQSYGKERAESKCAVMHSGKDHLNSSYILMGSRLTVTTQGNYLGTFVESWAGG